MPGRRRSKGIGQDSHHTRNRVEVMPCGPLMGSPRDLDTESNCLYYKEVVAERPEHCSGRRVRRHRIRHWSAQSLLGLCTGSLP